MSSFTHEPHGGPNYAELAALGLHPDDVLDFSANTNAYGPPPGVRLALATCDISHYPDRHAAPLHAALAEREGVSEESILIGAGAAGLIWTLALAMLHAGDRVFIVGPTFSEYVTASRLIGAQICEWRSDEAQAFAVDLDALRQAIGKFRPHMIWICNPNNPTGTYLQQEELFALLRTDPDALWVIDEAYRPFVASAWNSTPWITRMKVALVRSLTKDCAIPGIRLGYMLAAPGIIRRCSDAQPPWSVSAPAIACGLAVLEDETGHLMRTTHALREEANSLATRLRQKGWLVIPSATHFMLIKVGDAGALRRYLLREHRLQVRDCTSFGLPQYIRVAARRPEENHRLYVALRIWQSNFPHGEAFNNHGPIHFHEQREKRCLPEL